MWVKKKDLQPGDLVFFKNTYRRGLSHVGIYIGDGCFLHAPGRGKYVCLSRLDMPYFAHRWAGARRLDLSSMPQLSDENATPPPVVVVEPSDSDEPPVQSVDATSH